MNSTPSTSTEPSAEVLESSTAGWTAQCKALHCAPPFGSFIRAPDATNDPHRAVIYGVVSHIVTEPFDASRRPLALWTREDEMERRHPQIGKLLRTVFEARCIGWDDKGFLRQSLPPQPPRLHSFVLSCAPDEVLRLTERTSFVRLLIDNLVPNDELLVAACREAVEVRNGDSDYMLKLGQELVAPLRGDYHRLRNLLSRISEGLV
jgi:hypothetical protein